ncbi:MAG: efflux RND transporter periplasmic adaptor subunit, partial [Bacteroidales bacterium]|nr:efflux RND transporter periplasmic adaptor subunit [Bacteroidales bacterium]
LTKIKVKPGDKVKKGDVMFIIDQVSAKAELLSAQADVKSAQAAAKSAKVNLDAKKNSFSKGIISEVQVKKAENEYATARAYVDQAKARVTNAEQALSYTTVKAPCDGMVGELPYRVGTLVGPTITTPLTTVSNNDSVYAYFSATESDLFDFFSNAKSDSLNDGNFISRLPNVQLKLSNGEVYELDGRIESLSGVINPITGTSTIRAIFPNPNGKLRSGGAGEVILPYELKSVIVIPQIATYSIQDKVFAYKVIDNKAHSVEVKTIPTDDNVNCVVYDGLQAGDVIIAEGAGNVREGEEVSYKKQTNE